MIRMIQLCLFVASLSACQTSRQPRLATLEDGTPQNTATLTRVLAQAVGRAEVQLGPVDLARQPLISVLPPPLGPLEGASPAVPEIFELVAVGAACYVRRRRDEALFALPGLSCRPLDERPHGP
jgi:hypothetical protein